MALSNSLKSQFAKIMSASDVDTQKKKTRTGTAVEYEGRIYVQLDGSDQLTPLADRIAGVKDGDRVTIEIENHSASLTGNLSDPSVGSTTVDGIENQVEQFNVIIANKADIDQLNAAQAKIDELEANDVTITGKLDAVEANITDLQAENVEITGKLDAAVAEIEDLDATYATIDFANIGDAAIDNFFSKSGMIKDLVVSSGTVTGELVGVTIKGDLIEGGTVVADKLVILGDDGLYYKLNTNGETVTSEQTEYNSLSGTIITAKSITAEKIAVDDLVAFGATIGGFHITDSSLYSGVKADINNTTPGVYMDDESQFALGDLNNYLRFFKDTDGTYKLEISAQSIKISTSDKTIEDSLDDMQNQIDGMDSTVTTIQVDVDNITSSVTDLEGNYTQLTQTVEGISGTVSDVEGNVSSLTQTVNGISSTVTDLDGSMSSLEQTVGGFEARIEGVEEPRSNLFRIGAYQNVSNGAVFSSYELDRDMYHFAVPSTANSTWGGQLVQYERNCRVPWGDSATLSMGVYSSAATTVKFDLNAYCVSGYGTGNDHYQPGPQGPAPSFQIPAKTWTRVSITYSNTNETANTGNPYHEDIYDQTAVGFLPVSGQTISCAIREVKFEIGDHATAWAPSPNTSQTATNYLRFDSSGLCVGNMTAGTLGYNALITSSQYQIRNGGTVLSSFGASTVNLGQNSTSSKINLCGGRGTIWFSNNRLFINTSSDSYPIQIGDVDQLLLNGLITTVGRSSSVSTTKINGNQITIGNRGSAIQGIWAGSKVISCTNSAYQTVFTSSQITSMIGRAHGSDDVCLVMNGDSSAWNHSFGGPPYWNGSNMRINVGATPATGQQIRMNYIYIAV